MHRFFDLSLFCGWFLWPMHYVFCSWNSISSSITHQHHAEPEPACAAPRRRRWWYAPGSSPWRSPAASESAGLLWSRWRRQTSRPAASEAMLSPDRRRWCKTPWGAKRMVLQKTADTIQSVTGNAGLAQTVAGSQSFWPAATHYLRCLLRGDQSAATARKDAPLSWGKHRFSCRWLSLSDRRYMQPRKAPAAFPRFAFSFPQSGLLLTLPHPFQVRVCNFSFS